MRYAVLFIFFVANIAAAETKVIDPSLGLGLSDDCKKAIKKSLKSSSKTEKSSVILPECVPTPPTKKKGKK